jgi:hypothetical protein
VFRTAAVSNWILGLGFGLPGAYGAWYLAARHDTWTFLGFPTYRGDIFGIPTTVPLLLVYFLVCIAEVVIGWYLWRASKMGAIASLLLLPLELIFWIGFALPFGTALGLSRTALMLMAWSSLSP